MVNLATDNQIYFGDRPASMLTDLFSAKLTGWRWRDRAIGYAMHQPV